MKNKKSIIIYTSNMCSSCEMAKEYMKLKKVNFEEKNVSSNLEAQIEINKLGFDTTPVILIGTKVIDGFDPPKIDEAINSLST